MPTPIKKNGMKKAFPTNSSLFFKGDMFGIKRFNDTPTKNAPNTPSNPANWAKNAPKKTTAKTKINCKIRLIGQIGC